MEQNMNASSLDEISNILISKTHFTSVGVSPMEELEL